MDEDACKQCLMGIGRIESTLKMLNNNMMKIFFALLGVITAQIGSKYIGTPLHVEITMYSLMFGAVFVMGVTIWKWQCLNLWEKWIRISFVALCLWVTGLRIYHYQTDTAFTKNEGVITQLITISMALGFIVLAWRRDAMRRRKKRRWND